MSSRIDTKSSVGPSPPAARWRDASLAIVTPALGEVTVGYCNSLLALTRYLGSLDIPYGTCVQPGCTLLAEARSTFIASFLASRGTHLLMIDSDVEFAPEVVTRLLATDRDVVGVGVPSKRMNIDAVIVSARAGHPAPAVMAQQFDTSLSGASPSAIDGLVEVDWLATGIVLFKRSALERMVAGYPDLLARTSLYPQGPVCFLFQQLIEDGQILGEDVSFFRRWQRLGGKTHLLVDADIGHTGRFTFVGNFARRSEAAAEPRPMTSEPMVRPPQPPSAREPRRPGPQLGRDDPCPCGSGQPLEKCHGDPGAGTR